jgi:hypothetical protein
MGEDDRRDRRGDRGDRRPRRFERPPPDPAVLDAVKRVDDSVRESMEPVFVPGLNAFQAKMVSKHFGRGEEVKIKIIENEDKSITLKAYPVGKLRRLAETRAQKVLLSGETQHLPSMGSFERFVVHEYIKNRGGLRSESSGEGEERHVAIFPVFGRIPRKAKRRLS